MASDKFIIGLRAGLPSTRILKPPGGDSSDLFGLKTRQKAFFESLNKSATSMINERSRSILDKYKDFLSSKEDTSEEKLCGLDPGTVGRNNSTSDLQVGVRGDAFVGRSGVIKSAESIQSEELSLENSAEETSSCLTTPEHIRSSQISLEDADKCGDWKPSSENNPESTSKCDSPNSIPSSEISLKSEGKHSDWRPPSSRNSETASRCDSSEPIPSSQVSPKSTGISNSLKSGSALSPTSSSKRVSLKNVRSSQVSPKVTGSFVGRKPRSSADGEFLANRDSSKNRGAPIRKKTSSVREIVRVSPRESVITSKQVNTENSNAELETTPRKFIRNPITGQVTQIGGFLNSKRVMDAHDMSEGIKMSVIDADSTRLKKAAKIYVKRNPITGEGTEMTHRIHV